MVTSGERLLKDFDVFDLNLSSQHPLQEESLEKKNDVLIEICAEVYGLITGPPDFSNFQIFKELDFKKHPLAPCIVLMYDKKGDTDELSGIICVETDDLLGGGCSPKFYDAVQHLRKRYQFGKWKSLMDEPTEYGGRTIKQHRDYGFQISVTRYLKGKSSEIKLECGRGKDQTAPATPAEITQMRGVVGKLNWATREGMPQGAGDASLLASTLPNPVVKDLTNANAALRRLMHNDMPLHIRPIPFKRLGLLIFSDSSLGNAGQGKAQLANGLWSGHVDSLWEGSCD